MQKTCIYSYLFVHFLSSCNSTQMPDHGEKAKTRTLEMNDFHVFYVRWKSKANSFY